MKETSLSLRSFGRFRANKPSLKGPFPMRSFSLDDQKQFARWSGDFNPIHVDPIYARRTQAGAPVVHGVHALLWALDTVFGVESTPTPQIKSIKVQFLKYILINAQVKIGQIDRKQGEVRFKLLVGDLTAMVVALTVGEALSDIALQRDWTHGLTASPVGLQTLSVEQMAEASGRIDTTDIDGLDNPFSAATKALGRHRVIALAALSRLVGMTCPGLNSVFSSINLRFASYEDTAIFYRTTAADPRYRLVKMDVVGAGVVGNISAFARPSVSKGWRHDIVARHVIDGEFSGVRALIVGGSRGLGALAAHLLVAGGGQVVITYMTGRDDAIHLAQQLNGSVQQEACKIFNLDVLDQKYLELKFDTHNFTHLYYFATPHIFRQKTERFDPYIFDTFCRYYLSGFENIIIRCLEGGAGLTAFYPSSTFVTTPPAAMTEYAMAKAAGEVLCRQLHDGPLPVQIIYDRLPRLPTDQTSGIADADLADPIATMMDVVRRVSKIKPL
jgi:hypothetical protein